MRRHRHEPRYPRQESAWELALQAIGVWMMASGAIFLTLLIFGSE